MKRKHTKDWKEGDPRPTGWKEWEDLTDDAIGKVLHSLLANGEPLQREQFVLLILQRRENERNNEVMRALTWGTFIFTAISALFVALAAFDVI